MSLWSTRTTDTDRKKNYVVIKHKLRDVNGTIHGVKFRGGFAVIDKNTKRFKELTRLPLLKQAPEFPIEFLRKLKFITRSTDVKIIWGQDVYYYYMKALAEVTAKEKEVNKINEEQKHIEETDKCNFRVPSGELCKNDALELSPSGYCKLHILRDPKLTDIGFDIPKRLSKDEKKVYKEKLIKKLKSR